MVCKHQPNDPNCSSFIWGGSDPVPTTPDANNYEIIDALQIGKNLCVKVKYPNCNLCAYEGIKVLVYENIAPLDALKWKRIDPHFKNDRDLPSTHAPSPVARFPATVTGWQRAQDFAKTLNGVRVTSY